MEDQELVIVTERAGSIGGDIRSAVELLAGKLERLGVADRLMSCLMMADTTSRLDAELWRAACPYLAAMLLSVYGDGQAALEAVIEATGGAFIWNKIKGVLPDVTDDAAGAVIGGQMIERFFEKVRMSRTG